MDPFKPWQPKAPSRPLAKFDAESAQTLALQAIAFIAGDDELLERFIALSGCGLDQLKHRMADPAFLGGVLDFLLADETSLLAFTAATELAPESPQAARHHLP
jgi:hypothetical protein